MPKEKNLNILDYFGFALFIKTFKKLLDNQKSITTIMFQTIMKKNPAFTTDCFQINFFIF